MTQLIWLTKKDKLSSTEQLEFLSYLQQSLGNGFPLSISVELMPALWPKKAPLMQKLYTNLERGAHFSEELLKLGFSKTIAVQVKLAMRQGNLDECLKQLVILCRLKNEQLKKLKGELAYPFVLTAMMVILLLFMQTFVSSQFTDSDDHTGDYLLLGLVGLILSLTYVFIRMLRLLTRQDYRSLKRLSAYPIIGPTVKLYVNYLLIYDIGLLLASGFSLQKMCEYACQQEEGSLQQALGQKMTDQLSRGKNLTEIVKKEAFLPNSLLILLKTGAKRINLSRKCLVLGRTLFSDLTQHIEKLVINVQPFCFILIGLCIIGMYLKYAWC